THIEKGHHSSRPCRTLDFEIVPIILIEVQQRTDEKEVQRHPDWPAPVRVAAEHGVVGLRCKIRHLKLLALAPENIRVFEMVAGHRANTELAKKLRLVEHLGKDPG